MATYAVGNMGITGLQDDLVRLRTDPDTWVRQAAAASLHVLPPTVEPSALLDWARVESSPDVRFRLGLCLLEALEAGRPIDRTALGAWCETGLTDDRADLGRSPSVSVDTQRIPVQERHCARLPDPRLALAQPRCPPSAPSRARTPSRW